MDYREFKRTGSNLSLLGFGAMRLPTGPGGAVDEAAARRLIDTAYQGGVNYFDTAYLYHDGASEPFLGRALAGYPRESYHLATKLPLWESDVTVEQCLRIFDEQLARCQTEYFDFYLFHGLNATVFERMEKLGLYDLFRQKQADGLIRNLGFSFHDEAPVLKKITEAHPWDFAQLQLNYLDWEMEDAKALHGILKEKGIPCIVMEPVRGGRLADLVPEANAVLEAAAPGKSLASWAFRFVGALPNVACVLSGMSTMAQVEDNLATFDGLAPLAGGERAALDKAIDIFKQYAVVPCTACRYCMPCPHGLDIPAQMALYNACAFDGDGFSMSEKNADIPEGQRAADCQGCGVCEGLCPQHIPIIQTMRSIEAKVAGG